jgi:hypothetical protein
MLSMACLSLSCSSGLPLSLYFAFDLSLRVSSAPIAPGAPSKPYITSKPPLPLISFPRSVLCYAAYPPLVSFGIRRRSYGTVGREEDGSNGARFRVNIFLPRLQQQSTNEPITMILLTVELTGTVWSGTVGFIAKRAYNSPADGAGWAPVLDEEPG